MQICNEHSGVSTALGELKKDVREVRNLVVGLLVSVVLGLGGVLLNSCGVFEGGQLSATTAGGHTATLGAHETDAGCVELEAAVDDGNGNTIGAACVVQKDR